MNAYGIDLTCALARVWEAGRLYQMKQQAS